MLGWWRHPRTGPFTDKHGLAHREIACTAIVNAKCVAVSEIIRAAYGIPEANGNGKRDRESDADTRRKRRSVERLDRKDILSFQSAGDFDERAARRSGPRGRQLYGPNRIEFYRRRDARAND
jgi:hypothetical protein